MGHSESNEAEQEKSIPEGLAAIKQTVQLPISDEEVASLRVGEWVLVSGTLYIIGERAIRCLSDDWNETFEHSFAEDVESVFFAEATEAPLGKVIGSIGPLSIEEQGMFSCALLDAGVRCIIGSGRLNPEALERLKKKHGLYLVTASGIGALLARTVHQAEVVACESLGTEAIRRIKVSDLPCVIALDGFGRYLL